MIVPLPRSKSFGHRVAEYSPIRPRAGVLEIRESRAEGLKVRVSRYAVYEEDAADGFRTFRLTKPGGGVVYHTTVDPHRRTAVEDRCDCNAGCGHVWCRHQQALRVLIDGGHLPRILKET